LECAGLAAFVNGEVLLDAAGLRRLAVACLEAADELARLRRSASSTRRDRYEAAFFAAASVAFNASYMGVLSTGTVNGCPIKCLP
jgi:hypothetical protein